MKKLTKYERALLIFFLPLFALKILNVTAEDLSLKLVGVLCFCCFAFFVYRQSYHRNFFSLFNFLLFYTGILVLTSGKQAAFFSVVAIMLMYKVDMDKKLYRILFYFGVFFLLLTIGIESMNEVETTQRYINGEWVEMKKRNNILFVSFSAIVSLYLLIHRNCLKSKHILRIMIASVAMFAFVGSRTGLMVMVILVGMLVSLNKKRVFGNRLVKTLCVYSPLYCMMFCIYTGLAYEGNVFLLVLDMLFQGRIYQNN